MHAVSPCKKFQAVLRDVEQKDQKESAQYLEIWNETSLIRSVDLTALDLHAKVYTDGNIIITTTKIFYFQLCFR